MDEEPTEGVPASLLPPKDPMQRLLGCLQYRADYQETEASKEGSPLHSYHAGQAFAYSQAYILLSRALNGNLP